MFHRGISCIDWDGRKVLGCDYTCLSMMSAKPRNVRLPCWRSTDADQRTQIQLFPHCSIELSNIVTRKNGRLGSMHGYSIIDRWQSSINNLTQLTCTKLRIPALKPNSRQNCATRFRSLRASATHTHTELCSFCVSRSSILSMKGVMLRYWSGVTCRVQRRQIQ